MRAVNSGGLVSVTKPNTTSCLSRVIFLLSGRFCQFSSEDFSYGYINPVFREDCS